MKKAVRPILTSSLRIDLETIMQAEIQKTLKLMELLEPKNIINTILKMMPYMFPRVESVSLTEGESEGLLVNWQSSLEI
jgi:hypothetical protein